MNLQDRSEMSSCAGAYTTPSVYLQINSLITVLGRADFEWYADDVL